MRQVEFSGRGIGVDVRKGYRKSQVAACECQGPSGWPFRRSGRAQALTLDLAVTQRLDQPTAPSGPFNKGCGYVRQALL